MTKRIIAVVLVLSLALIALSACGTTLSGTYKTKDVLGSYTSLKFSGSKITIKVYLAGSEISSAEGKYKIDDGTITITLNEGEKSELDGNLAFSKDGDTIKIGLLTFTKE